MFPVWIICQSILPAILVIHFLLAEALCYAAKVKNGSIAIIKLGRGERGVKAEAASDADDSAVDHTAATTKFCHYKSIDFCT